MKRLVMILFMMLAGCVAVPVGYDYPGSYYYGVPTVDLSFGYWGGYGGTWWGGHRYGPAWRGAHNGYPYWGKSYHRPPFRPRYWGAGRPSAPFRPHWGGGYHKGH